MNRTHEDSFKTYVYFVKASMEKATRILNLSISKWKTFFPHITELNQAGTWHVVLHNSHIILSLFPKVIICKACTKNCTFILHYFRIWQLYGPSDFEASQISSLLEFWAEDGGAEEVVERLAPPGLLRRRRRLPRPHVHAHDLLELVFTTHSRFQFARTSSLR